MKVRELVITSLLLLGAATAQTVIWSDNMSSFPSGWTLTGTTSNYWTKSSTRYNSASYSAKCTPYSTYNNNVDVQMTRTVSISSSYAYAYVAFYVWQNTEASYDWVQLQYSTNSGSTWNTAWQRAGNYSSWGRIQYAVSPLIPATTNRIRFRFYSDGSTTYEGVYIDDVVLYGVKRLTVFTDDMSYFPNSWTLVGSPAWTRVTYNPYNYYSAKCCDKNSYGYYNNQNNSMQRTINLSGYMAGELSFRVYCDIQSNYDYGYAKYYSGSSWYTLATFTGSSVWKQYGPYTVPSGATKIGFFFSSNASTTWGGLQVDDVGMYKLGGSFYGPEDPTPEAEGVMGEPRNEVADLSVRSAPNPFSGRTEISYAVPGNGSTHVTLRVYDAAGKVVRTLLDGTRTGASSVTWDARDDRGARVVRGVYIARLLAGESAATVRLVLVE
jgi:hypothetical protein